jgi:outer membrane protein
MPNYLKLKWKLLIVTVYLCTFQANAQSQTLSLKESINYSLHHHPSSTIYKYAAQSAAEKIRENKAAFLPTVAGSVGLDYNMKLQTSIIPAGSFSDTETKLQMGNKFSNTAYIQADQNLFDRSSSVNIAVAKTTKPLCTESAEVCFTRD